MFHRPLHFRAAFLTLVVVGVFVLSGCATTTAVSLPLPRDALNKPARLTMPLRVVWITPLVQPGDAIPFHAVEYAEPLVHEGRIYVGAGDGVFFCLSATSGKALWRFKAFGPIESRPTIAGSLVVFGDSDGMIYALDRQTGLSRWTYQVGGEVMGQPVADEDSVYVATAYNRLYALKLADGVWRWMYQRDVPGTFTVRGVTTPVPDGDVIYLGLSDGYVVAVDRKSGKEVWKNLLKIDERLADVDSTPLVESDSIYVAAYDGALYRLGRESGDVEWKSDNVGGVSRPVSVGDYLITASTRGYLFAIKKSDGTRAWELDLRREDRAGSVSSADKIRLKTPSEPILFGNVVLTVSNDGYLYAVDPRVGAVVWRYDPGNGATGGFARDDDRVYFVANGGHLFALGAAASALEPAPTGVLSNAP